MEVFISMLQMDVFISWKQKIPPNPNTLLFYMVKFEVLSTFFFFFLSVFLVFIKITEICLHVCRKQRRCAVFEGVGWFAQRVIQAGNLPLVEGPRMLVWSLFT